MAILIFLTPKPSLLLLNLNKELKLSFSQHQVYDFEKAGSKKRKLLSYSATSFSFTDIY